MNFIWIMIVAFIVYKLTWHNLFSWETVIKYLWRNILKEINLISEQYKKEKENLFAQNFVLQKYEKSIKLKGEIVNSILNWVNYCNKESKNDGEECEEETFGYGYFNFDSLIKKAIEK